MTSALRISVTLGRLAESRSSMRVTNLPNLASYRSAGTGGHVPFTIWYTSDSSESAAKACLSVAISYATHPKLQTSDLRLYG